MAVPSNTITAFPVPVATQRALASSHRLPTVSASEALQGLHSAGPETVSTTLGALDTLLSGGASSAVGGFERGKTSELWGPPGGGKTALMLQTAAHELIRGEKVLWLDCASPLGLSRLDSSLKRQAEDEAGMTAAAETLSKYGENLAHRRMPTLSHLLALLVHSRPGFPPLGTSLVVVRSLNTIIDMDYPRVLFANSSKTPQQKWQAGRRYAILGSVIASLNKLAVLNNLAVVVGTGCASRTRMDSGLGSALVPGVGGPEWDGGVWSRCVLFRDFACRFVGVQKCQGRSLIGREEIGEPGQIVGFDIDRDGAVRQRGFVSDAAVEEPLTKMSRSPVKPRKRAFDEVADSEGEDADEYGWAETDETIFATDAAPGDATERTTTNNN
ncbi:hypothetical protein LTR53_010696 [Teratosphaeriaceae sp. CCFEE 6253]|nr:hypothetical protein LTR53_010696 [Teratosphaeriaceae sp. CCFEE 6253]